MFLTTNIKGKDLWYFLQGKPLHNNNNTVILRGLCYNQEKFYKNLLLLQCNTELI